MKKMLFAALAAIVALASCDKSDNSTPNVPPTDGYPVRIDFVQDQAPASRYFFDPAAAAEPWEKRIDKLSIFVFGTADGSLVVRRDVSATELAAGSLSFALPWTAVDNNAGFYAVANYDVPSNVTTEAAFKALLDVAASQYNGAADDVMTKALRTGGFTMSAYKAVALISTGTNSVALGLKRTVAKIAIKTTPAADFFQRFGAGTIKVKNIEIVNVAKQTALIGAATPAASAYDLTMSQESKMSGDIGANLFYIFENGPRTGAERVTLKVTATYDPDGFYGSGPEQEMVYEVPLTDDGGAIRRNGYYRISLTINGLNGYDCQVGVTVEDWESPINRDISLGD